MSTKEEQRTAMWNAEAKKRLEGRTIVEARYATKEEAEVGGWDERGIVLTLDNDVVVVVARDDEGNGPGALFVDDTILPVLY